MGKRKVFFKKKKRVFFATKKKVVFKSKVAKGGRQLDDGEWFYCRDSNCRVTASVCLHRAENSSKYKPWNDCEECGTAKIFTEIRAQGITSSAKMKEMMNDKKKVKRVIRKKK